MESGDSNSEITVMEADSTGPIEIKMETDENSAVDHDKDIKEEPETNGDDDVVIDLSVTGESAPTANTKLECRVKTEPIDEDDMDVEFIGKLENGITEESQQMEPTIPSIDCVLQEMKMVSVKKEIMEVEETSESVDGNGDELLPSDATLVPKMEVDESYKVPKMEPLDGVDSEDPALVLIKKEVNAAIKVYQKYFDDMNLPNRVSQPKISAYTRAVLLRKMNANTVHIDGYYARIEIAKTVQDFQALLDEITDKNRRARESRDVQRLLGDEF